MLRRSIRELCFEDHGDDPQTLDNWLANKTAESVHAWVESAEDFCTVAVGAAGDIVGFGMLSRPGELLLLYVSPEAVGKGAGYALLVAMEQQAASWELEAITLDSTLTARKFYERNGYESIRKSAARTDRTRTDGLSCDAMRKRLHTD
ncbi:MAG: GNAT family N-acetyltransferase [Gammaproteobacteria bacterium]